MDNKSQAERILATLKLGHRVTPLSALKAYGCLRLAARIYDLRRKGHKIERRMVSHKGSAYAEYRLALDASPGSTLHVARGLTR